MFTLSNIIFAGLLFISLCLWIFYTYLAIWRIPMETERIENLGWLAMICASAATFCLLLAWRLKEPLAKDFLPVFLVISLVIGYLFRESAISPYKLEDFWLKFGTGRKREDKQANNKNN